MPRWSQADLLRAEARLRDLGGLRPQVPGKAVMREARLHEEILEECKARGWIALHGSMAHRTHRTVGEPDFVILASGGRTFLVEAKAASGKPSLFQRILLTWASKLGHQVAIVRSLEEFQTFISGASTDDNNQGIAQSPNLA
jgi:hypothetical protein